jgi:hypothetical protein
MSSLTLPDFVMGLQNIEKPKTGDTMMWRMMAVAPTKAC